jgi:alanine racemase
VTLLGGQNGTALGADDVAAAAGTIAHEVLCGVSARVPRVVVNRP